MAPEETLSLRISCVIWTQVSQVLLDLGQPTRDTYGASLYTSNQDWTVKDGVVTDHGNGSYTATLCPVIAVSM